MSLRISEITEGDGTTLRVDGRLLRDDVVELIRASANAPGPLTLDLGGLLFADAEGVGALNQLRAGGAGLRNVPPYVALLLGMPATADESRGSGSGRPPSAKHTH